MSATLLSAPLPETLVRMVCYGHERNWLGLSWQGCETQCILLHPVLDAWC